MFFFHYLDFIELLTEKEDYFDEYDIYNLEDIMNSNSDNELDDNLENNYINIDLNEEEEISQDNSNKVRARKRKHDVSEADNNNNLENERNEKQKKLGKNFINNKNIESDIIINNDVNSKISKIDNLEEENLNLEVNMHEYEICINHIDYLIRCYDKTINYYNKDKNNIYDIIKLKETVEYLNDIKYDCCENQQNNIIFKDYYNNSKTIYKKDYLDLIFFLIKK